MGGEMKIKDDSGDRDFFTIIPNYIINHSTANDRALYLEMKRFAGEDGKCFATQETMQKRLEIGKIAFNKSLNYLIKKGWINFLGLTGGKTRPIKTYKINNIWKENSDYYKKIPPKTEVSLGGEIPPRTDGDTSQNGSKIPPRTAVEEDPSLSKNQEEEDATQSVAGKEINEIIDLFKTINPSYQKLFRNKNQRAAIERMLKEHGREKLEWAINVLSKTNLQKYMPIITTPIQLEDKLAILIFNLKKESFKGIQSL